MLSGSYTALATPMRGDGSVDYNGFERLVEFNLANGVSGLVVCGTTGETPCLSTAEYRELIERTVGLAKGRATVIAGSGGNNTDKVLAATAVAVEAGVDAVLLVDPYYNGPGSLEIRREYLGPVAAAFPQVAIITYTVPGRTGTALTPQDLALLHRAFPNVAAVKEATGIQDNAVQIRRLCGDSFAILSGDDERTGELLRDPQINADGVISVMANLMPGPMQQWTEHLRAGRWQQAAVLEAAIRPLLSLVQVETREQGPWGVVSCKARNPVPLKTLMSLLGMPSGPCRRPLGRMTRQGVHILLEAARQVQQNDPTVFAPIARFFGVDVDQRLAAPRLVDDLCYDQYASMDAMGV